MSLMIAAIANSALIQIVSTLLDQAEPLCPPPPLDGCVLARAGSAAGLGWLARSCLG